MRDVEVYIREELVEWLKKANINLMEFIADLHGVFGTFERVRGFAPFTNYRTLTGEEIVEYKIPAKYGMLIGLKKLCNKYGATNFIFSETKKKMPDGFYSFNEMENELFSVFKKL